MKSLPLNYDKITNSIRNIINNKAKKTVNNPKGSIIINDNKQNNKSITITVKHNNTDIKFELTNKETSCWLIYKNRKITIDKINQTIILFFNKNAFLAIHYKINNIIEQIYINGKLTCTFSYSKKGIVVTPQNTSINNDIHLQARNTIINATIPLLDSSKRCAETINNWNKKKAGNRSTSKDPKVYTKQTT
ncbi:MAG: hypothetical protein Q4G04_04115 [bacterium]|nr:hypothetical protein [bacterium]